jgi:hypothetical protein
MSGEAPSRWAPFLAVSLTIHVVTLAVEPGYIKFGGPSFNAFLFFLGVPSLAVGPVLMTRYRPAFLSERLAAYVAMAGSLFQLMFQLDVGGLIALFYRP